MMKSDIQNILIIGAGNAGRQLLRELKRDTEHKRNIVGFLDDDKRKFGKKIADIPILGDTQKLEDYVTQYSIDIIFIAFPSAHGRVIRAIAERCRSVGVECRVIPKILEIIQNKVSLNLVRPVAIEDLVGRPIIKHDQSMFAKLFKGKRVLVTGAAGSIGSELVRQILEFLPKHIICFDSGETALFELEQELRGKRDVKKTFIIGSVQEYKKVEKVVQEHKPDIIFHAAAYKHVHIMNNYPEEAVKNNIVGTKNVAEIAGKYKVGSFIFISTDKAVHPLGIMGASKAFGEALIGYYQKKYSTTYCAVRFGNVLGSHGSVVPLFQKQIAQGGPITITHPEMTRFFMTIPEAVQLILHACRIGEGGDIFVLDMGEPMKIIDLATTMVRLSGLELDRDIHIEITGVRPGEKLSEELFTEKELLDKTSHNLLFKTQSSPVLHDKELMSMYNVLVSLAYENKRKELVQEFKKIFPTLAIHKQ